MGLFRLGDPEYPARGLRNRIRIDQGITLILSTVLILQGLITILYPINASKAETTAGKTKPEVYQHIRELRYGDNNILSDISETDRQHKIREGGVAEQRIRDLRKLISQSFYAMIIAISGIWLLRSLGQVITNRKAFCKSLLALSIGGHAPPILDKLRM